MESAVASEPFQLMLGDCLDRLKELPADSVDAIVTDPPYGLEFMGKEWDTFKAEPRKVAGTGGTQAPFAHHAVKLDAQRGMAFQQWCQDWATECLRVLKPGGHLLAFGGSRTYHRLASAIEDAGFEIRDQIMWLYGCLSDDTQCLTRLGWKSYTALTTADEVLQWNPQTEELSWVYPDAVHVYPYSGELLRLKNRHTDQLLTPNHRVFAKVRRHSRNPSPSEFSVLQACELRPHWQVDLPVAGFLKAGRRVTCAYLVGWWLTDAWKHADGRAAMFSQSKPRTLQKLGAALEPFSPSEYTKPPKKTTHNTEHTFYVAGELADYLLSEFPERELTWDVLSWDQESRTALLEGLLDGDGSVPAGQNSMAFWSKNADRLDVFQALCLSLGYRSCIDYRRGCVYLRSKTTTQTQSIHRQEPVPYEGNVWCLAVPTGAFVVRRIGRAFITGNSGFPKSLDVSKAIDAKLLYGGSNTSRLKEVNKSRPGKGRARSSTKNDGIMGSDSGPKITKDDPATAQAARWQGFGTALKPAHETIVVARKPLVGTVAENVLQYGTGGINIDACRIPCSETLTGGGGKLWSHYRDGTQDRASPKANEGNGRWPANVIHDGSGEVIELFPRSKRQQRHAKGTEPNANHSEAAEYAHEKGRAGEASAMKRYTEQGSTDFAPLPGPRGGDPKGRWPANVIHDGSDEVVEKFPCTKSGKPGTMRKGCNDGACYGKESRPPGTPMTGFGDSGSAARFFYSAKCSRKDRNRGCEQVVTWENVDLSREMDALLQLVTDTSEDTMRFLEDEEWSTTFFGRNTTGLSQKDLRFTIETVSKLIIELRTLNCSRLSSTRDCILAATRALLDAGLNLAECAASIKTLKQNFTNDAAASALGVVSAVLTTLSTIIGKGKRGNVHSTVKPTELMRYLVRLVTPPGGTVLDPFMGSGSTGKAAALEGFRFIGIEKERPYFEIAQRRVEAEYALAV